jgi:hypothetical protein
MDKTVFTACFAVLSIDKSIFTACFAVLSMDRSIFTACFAVLFMDRSIFTAGFAFPSIAGSIRHACFSRTVFAAYPPRGSGGMGFLPDVPATPAGWLPACPIMLLRVMFLQLFQGQR